MKFIMPGIWFLRRDCERLRFRDEKNIAGEGSEHVADGEEIVLTDDCLHVIVNWHCGSCKSVNLSWIMHVSTFGTSNFCS